MQVATENERAEALWSETHRLDARHQTRVCSEDSEPEADPPHHQTLVNSPSQGRNVLGEMISRMGPCTRHLVGVE